MPRASNVYFPPHSSLSLSRTHSLSTAPASLRPAVLVGLYEEPERPPNAVEWVKKVLGAPVGVDVDALRADNERLKAMVASLQEQLEAAKANK